MKRTGIRTDPEQVREWKRRSQERARERAKQETPRRTLQRKTKLARVNPKRRAQRFARAYHSIGFVQWMRSGLCDVPSCFAPDPDVAHIRSRGAGGSWEDTLRLCRPHHRAQHDMGWPAFARKHRMDPEAIAHKNALRWKAFSHTDAA